ncbi:LacI family DNA-binding transcriptional regulator [Nocardia sp. CDC153]|uniref:LacI family DNA-binding transcriptional regulator n=1 Tax=Nocardia sp. CDC153 TaxID=3112167 RepID=UPI002DB5AA22|nr:LacI family DNA-binding transcriptional regulator [Nocardia sp. CDC153]MEC3954056.1 LacI family DNA-binding transcriptional regulator [Nocardia sp. CDC153]
MPVAREPVTQRDVAASLGVSISAVSLALSGRPGVGDDLRRRILDRAAELGYRPNASAVALRTSRTRVLGLLIRNLRNPHFLDVIDGFDETCARAGYEVMVGSSRYDPTREAQLVDAFQHRAIDGLAIAPIGTNHRVRERFSATSRPVVLLDTAAPDAATMSVRSDQEASVDLAVQHLLELGHRRVAMVVAPDDKSPDPERLQHFRRLAADLGFTADTVTTELSADAARTALRQALERDAATRPTAFITNSDYIAHTVYLAAADLGLSIPEDISVIGHDDLPTSASLYPALTTIAVDRRSIGEQAATLLIDALAGGPGDRTNIVVPVELRVRSSTARPAGGLRP